MSETKQKRRVENEDTWLSKLQNSPQNRSTDFCLKYTEFAFFPHRDQIVFHIRFNRPLCLVSFVFPMKVSWEFALMSSSNFA